MNGERVAHVCAVRACGALTPGNYQAARTWKETFVIVIQRERETEDGWKPLKVGVDWGKVLHLCVL